MTRSNRYAGRCASCGDHVEPRAGSLVRRGSRWLVYCADDAPSLRQRYYDAEGARHHDDDDGSEIYAEHLALVRALPGITVTTFGSGEHHFQNARGRCEDAPCCGCCS